MAAEIRLHLKCDWPGCASERDANYHLSIWHDIKWKPEQFQVPFGRVLCSEHRFNKFGEIDKMLEEINSMGTL